MLEHQKADHAQRARDALIDLLTGDHKRTRKAFRAFRRLDPKVERARCVALVEQTCAELQIHAAIEEELLYPAARAVLKSSRPIDKALIEHTVARRLIEQLQRMTPDDPRLPLMFELLGAQVRRRIWDEEETLLRFLCRASLDWVALYKAIQTRRAALMEELLPQPLDIDESDHDPLGAQSREAVKVPR